MIKVGIGTSTQADSSLAAQEVARQARQSGELQSISWGILFFSPHHINQAEEIRRQLTLACNTEQIVGCSGAGVISALDEWMGVPAMVLLLAESSDAQALPFMKYQELPGSDSPLRQIKTSVEGWRGSRAENLVILPDVYHHQAPNLLNMCRYLKGSPKVFGAGSSDDGSVHHSVQFGPEGVSDEGIAGIAFDDGIRFEVGVTQSCIPVVEPMFITEAESNHIRKLDGNPALEVYSTLAAQLKQPSIERAVRTLLVGFPLDQEIPDFHGENYIARPLSGIDVPTQALVVPQLIQAGGVLTFVFRSSVTAQEDMNQMLSRLKARNTEKPLFGLYFNCAARGESLYQESNVDVEMIRSHFGNIPLIGMFGGYELATVMHGTQQYSYTGVLALAYPKQ